MRRADIDREAMGRRGRPGAAVEIELNRVAHVDRDALNRRAERRPDRRDVSAARNVLYSIR
jgi:hypothetical protein